MRLLIVSDSPALFSGQARVVRELAGRFRRDGLDVHVAGWFHQITQPMVFPYPVFPARKDKPETLAPVLDLGWDVVLAIGDPWDFEWLAKYHAEQGGQRFGGDAAPKGRKGFKLVGYLNVEAGPMKPKWEVIFDGFDVVRTTSEFGASVVNRPGITAVHHGVDRTVFFPAAKPQAVGGLDIQDKFVVLINAQNSQRKNLAAALTGFALFAQGKYSHGQEKYDRVLCYANTVIKPGQESAPGQNLGDLVVEHGIDRIVCFNPDNEGPLRTVSDKTLNGIYSLADVLLVSSIAEGFGLPILEAMATKTVPIAPEAFSMPELLSDGRGLMYPVSATYRGEQGTEAMMAHPDSIAWALETAFDLWKGDPSPQFDRPREQFEAMQDAGMAFAISRPWDRTYSMIAAAVLQPVQPRVANGLPIEPYLRIRAHRLRKEKPSGVAVVKIGGLGDMLQTSVVVRAAARKYDQPITVFVNRGADIFKAMPEVAGVQEIPERQLQEVIVRSIAPIYDIVLDVRYISRVLGNEDPAPFFLENRYFYDRWPGSCNRIAMLDRHTTSLMLLSLGLAEYAPRGSDIRPIFEPRGEGPDVAKRSYIALASGFGDLGRLKAWPDASWVKLAKALTDRDIPYVQVGGEDDPSIPGAIPWLGKDLPSTATALANARAVVAVEGGMAHLAAAVGTPAGVLCGPTPPVCFVYPGQQAFGQELCRPCWMDLSSWGHGECALGVSSCVNFAPVEDVLAYLGIQS